MGKFLKHIILIVALVFAARVGISVNLHTQWRGGRLGEEVVFVIEKGSYVAKLYNASKQAIKEIDWALAKQVQGLDGKVYTVITDPIEGLKNAAAKVKQVLRDAEGKELKDAAGNTLVEMDDGAVGLAKNVQGAGKVGLLNKLNSYTNLKTWANTLDDVVDGSLISKLDGIDASYLTKLEADIASASNGAGLKSLLKESPDDLTNIWKVLKDDPNYSFELAKTGGSRWEKWAQGDFFKTVTKAGKDFEEFVANNLSVLRSKLLSKYPNIDLNNYAIFEQVQIKTGQIANGADEFFVADFILVKKEINAITGVENLNFNSAIVLETKLSSTTALTTPQTDALAKVKTTSNTFDIRSISKNTKDNKYFLGSGTEYKNLKITDYIKVYSNGVGNTIQDINSLK